MVEMLTDTFAYKFFCVDVVSLLQSMSPSLMRLFA